WAMTQNNLGNAYSDRIRGDKAQNIEAAIAAYEQALLVRTLEADPINHLQTTNNLGNLYFDNQNWQLAADNYKKAITAVELSRSWATTDDRRQEILKENINIYNKAIQAYIHLKKLEQALEIAERSQARNLVQLLTNRDLVPQDNVPPEITQQLQQQQKEIRVNKGELEKVRKQLSQQNTEEKTSLEKSEKQLNEELQKLRQQLEKTFNQIQEYDPTFRLTQEVQPIAFREIQQLATEQQTAIIEWYIMGEKFLAFILVPPTSTATSELFMWQSTEDGLKNLQEWAQEYVDKYYELKIAHQENQEKAKKLQQEWETKITTRLEKLGEILHIKEILQPILESECQRLTLIPHSFLHFLPLHILPINNPENSQENPEKKYLQDYFNQGVSYAPSCQILQKVRERKNQEFQSLFAIQNLNDTENSPHLGIISIIKKQFNNVEIIQENQATKSALINHPKLSLANSILFFCHGVFNPTYPLDSGLILADEKLTLGDIIQNLNLSKCRLVTLAACETGLTDIFNQEYVGLPSGFLLAGSTNIIASLWSVRVDATALLMLRLYQELKKYDNIIIALKIAQNWLRDTKVQELKEWVIKSPLKIIWQEKLEETFTKMENLEGVNCKPYNSPYFWAGFCVVGKGE
ncbi:MAG: CHAT domain-containing protein, partial [Trichodesmium erythraeum GBRTRLIN201]|nr:CHAT domain-containing protein [Trichodesmium erythraeum GBRTRLIN201]